MFVQTLFRLIGVPLAVLALALTLVTSARAGGEDPSTGPSVLLSPPSLALDGQGRVVVIATLVCWDEAVGEEAHVPQTVILGQPLAGGGASLEATCAAEPQTLTLTVASDTGHAFGPGRVSGILEYEVYTSKGGGFGDAMITEVLLPIQAGR